MTAPIRRVSRCGRVVASASAVASGAALVVALVAALCACDLRKETKGKGAPAMTSTAPAASLSTPAYIQPSGSAPPLVAGSGPTSFAALAAQSDPAVVFVETEQAMVTPARRIVGEGLGSGFVFDPNGLILTNYHVIVKATRIDIVFSGDRRMRAQVVGVDPPTDVAVVRVEAKGLPHLLFGDSDGVRVGDWVVAIGNPFGLSHTVSAGILSAKGRTHKDVQGLDPSGYYDFLQTDASINPGNSGGPLLDLSGTVVGINAAIKPQANNIGFAIPINMVKELLPSLIKHGRVQRSAIGAVVASLKESDVQRLGVADRAGALVTRLVPGGPGDRAGLRMDDVIVSFDGIAGAGPHRLRWLASIAGVGRTVTLKILRGSRTVDLKVTLGELPKQPEEESPMEEIPFP